MPSLPLPRTAVLTGGLIGVALLAAGLIGAGPRWWRSHSHADPPPATADAARTIPLPIPPRVRGFLPLRPEDRDQVVRRIQPLDRQHNPVSLCLHVLRVHGLEARFTDADLPSSAAIVDRLTDESASQAYFGHAALVRTRSGARYPTSGPRSRALGRWTETHRDQVLAALGELGIPLSQPLRFPDETLSLREVLRDSIANFHLHQDELVWTALAYSLYLPPQRTWTNRYGEATSFDQLAEELLRSPMEKASCAGTHLVYTLTVLARVDQQEPVLGEPTRQHLWHRLRQARDVAIAGQESDGSWPLDWNRELLDEPVPKGFSPDVLKIEHRLLATSHLAEWVLYLPDELAVPKQCPERAGWWLYEQLRTATPEMIKQNFCPYSHAACVVRQLALGSEEAPSQSVRRGR